MPQQKTGDALLRLPDVLSIIPVSRATWYAGIKLGRYPESVRIGPRCVAWRTRDIQTIVDAGAMVLD